MNWVLLVANGEVHIASVIILPGRKLVKIGLDKISSPYKCLPPLDITSSQISSVWNKDSTILHVQQFMSL